MNTEKLRELAPDLNQTAPRSPRAPLGEDFPALAARLVDKCRAELVGVGGSYHYDCPLDRRFFAATGLEAGALREFIATGAQDGEVASWMSTHARAPLEEIVASGRRFRLNPLLRLLDFDDWVHRRRHAGHPTQSEGSVKSQ
ncbi:MAG: DUF5069 domain-containing protein [Chthoniobacterales bacterium]